MPRTRSTALLVLSVALVLGACTRAESDSDAIAVQASDTACNVTALTGPAGSTTFTVTNSGTEVTEFYVYAADGATIVAEVEDVTPGLVKDLTATLDAGTYELACKPGERDPGIRVKYTATSTAE
jgi:iron uptake system component EfeO